MSKLTFARRSNGDFDFGESRLARLNADLRQCTGETPRIPESLMAAASRELIRATHEAADRRKVDFVTAVAAVVRDRPHLLALTRGIAVRDGAHEADIEIDA